MTRRCLPMPEPRPGAERVVCSWWARCDRPAEVEVEHPILGWVPTCPACAERVRRA